MAGVRHGRRLAHKQARHDAEEIIDELRAELDDVGHYQEEICLDTSVGVPACSA